MFRSELNFLSKNSICFPEQVRRNVKQNAQISPPKHRSSGSSHSINPHPQIFLEVSRWQESGPKVTTDNIAFYKAC